MLRTFHRRNEWTVDRLLITVKKALLYPFQGMRGIYCFLIGTLLIFLANVIAVYFTNIIAYIYFPPETDFTDPTGISYIRISAVYSIIFLLGLSFIFGYLIRIVQGILVDDWIIPQFNNWMGLFRTGVRFSILAIIIVILQVAIVDIIFSATLIEIILVLLFGDDEQSIIIVRPLVILAGISYLIPAVICIYAQRELYSDVFALSRYRYILFDPKYAILVAFPVIVLSAIFSIWFVLIGIIASPVADADTLISSILVLAIGSVMQYYVMTTIWSAAGANWTIVSHSRIGNRQFLDLTRRRRLDEFTDD